jgi:prepilin-type N-terminal cleavage/methylation domain-containing protein
MKTKKQLVLGFTLTELIVVMTIVGILAAVSIVSYGGIQSKAREVSIQSDIERMDGIQTDYALKNHNGGKAYYSGDGVDPDLNFAPSNGNVISVVINSTDYCIRGYNTDSLVNSIDNALYKESSEGVCALLSAADSPAVPGVTVVAGGDGVLATIIPVTCISGTTQYSIESRTNDGEWAVATDWGVNMTSTQTVNEGIKYGYRVNARCYVSSSLISLPTVGEESSYTSPVNPPSAPGVAVTFDSTNILATANTVTCTLGTPQYSFDSRTNDGIWQGFGSWSTSETTTQSPIQGYKYGYRAQARCYVSSTLYSTGSTGSEGNYILPITSIPATPSVVASTPNWTTTNYSWNATTCPTGALARYQYDFTTSYGYDSGWIDTTGTSASFSTSTFGYTYTLQVKTQCYHDPYSTGPWSAVGSGSYYRPYPTVQVLVVAGGGGGGSSSSEASGGGAGGGGVLYHSAKGVSSQTYWVTVGGGGTGGSGGLPNATNGGNSAFQDIVAFGGGVGGYTNEAGGNGGNGGGGAGAKDGSTNDRGYTTQYSTGGAGPVPGYAYGYNGGLGQHRTDGKAGGGGGGAGQCGGSALDGDCGGKMVGGNGAYSSITGASVCYAGGGGGGSDAYWGAGQCHGGNGAQNGTGAAGGTNTGGGGGGGANGGNGGSGIVIIRYPTAALGATGGSAYTTGSDTVRIFYGSANFQVY